MQKVISKTITTSILILLFSIPFLGMVMTYSSQDVKMINATIVSFNIPTGKITLKDERRNTYVLEAGSEIDLKTYRKGEAVVVAYETDGIVRAMSRP